MIKSEKLAFDKDVTVVTANKITKLVRPVPMARKILLGFL